MHEQVALVLVRNVPAKLFKDSREKCPTRLCKWATMPFPRAYSSAHFICMGFSSYASISCPILQMRKVISLVATDEWMSMQRFRSHAPPGCRPGETYPAGLIFRTLKGERLPLRSDLEPSATLQDPAGWKPLKRGVSVKRNKGDYTLFFALSNYGR